MTCCYTHDVLLWDAQDAEKKAEEESIRANELECALRSLIDEIAEADKVIRKASRRILKFAVQDADKVLKEYGTL